MVTTITDWYELDDIRNDLTGDYELANDLTPSTAGYDDVASANANGGSGWDPIGDSDNQFDGTFDGNVYTIDGLYSDRPNTDNVGLFSDGENDAKMRNITLRNVDITGNERVGAVVGYFEGVVLERISVDGTVTGNGGEVGMVAGKTDSSGISQLRGAGEATGSVAGGLIGTNRGDLTDSGTTATVDSGFAGGGLVGKNDGRIKRCYAAGTVDEDGSATYAGGVAGQNYNSIADNYWDTETTGQSNAVGYQRGSTSNVVGLTTAEMQGKSAESNMSAFDFSTGWTAVFDPDDYPEPVRLVYGNGDGTDSNPYEIRTWDHLDNVRLNPDASFKLLVSLDDTEPGYDDVASQTANGGNGFEPIGDDTTPFTGSIDGFVNSIHGLVIDRSAESDVGLFGVVDGGTITYLTVDAETVVGDGSVGALVGTLTGSGTVSKSGGTTTVDGTDTVGGLIGDCDSGTVTDSFATGDVSGDATIGGLVGRNAGSLEQSYATGTISGSTDVGGVVGLDDGGSISGSYWDTESTGRSAGVGSGDATGTTGLTTSEMQGSSAESNMSALNFDAIWKTQVSPDEYPLLVKQYAGGNGTALHPYEIADWEQLDNVRQDLSTNFKLVADLDSTSTGYDELAGKSANGGSGWNPIGDSNNPCTGTFDGNGHTISELYIDRPSTENVGLVSYLDGTISNLTLTSIDITGNNDVGGIVGTSYKGSIEDCSADGTVHATNQNVGGIAGSTLDSMVRCVSHCDVSAADFTAGGIAGIADGVISACVATGTVSGGDGASNLGGLIGQNGNSTITDSYALGAVEVTNGSGVGGLTGHISNLEPAEISECYTAATVTTDSSSNVGGFVGKIDDNGGGSSVTTSYWDTEATGQSDGIGTRNGGTFDATGLATSEMQGESAKSNMSALDFDNTWTPLFGPDDYPAFQWEYALFEVTITSTDDPVEQGRTLTVDASVENTDGESDTQSVTLDPDSAYSDSTTLTLASGQSKAVTLDTKVVGADPGSNTITVTSRTDRATTTVEVLDRFTSDWTADTDGGMQASIPAVGSSNVYTGGLGSEVRAFDRSQEQQTWSFDRDGALADSTPFLDESRGQLYVGSGGGFLYAIDTGGSEVWRHETGSAITASPVLDNGTVFVGSNDGTIWALDADTGNVQWSSDVGTSVYSQPAIDSNRVYVTDIDGTIHALDRAGGGERWTHQTVSDLVTAGPTVDSGTVYAATDAVYALNASDGSQVWQTGYAGTAGSTPVVDSGTLYVGDIGGTVHALDITNSGNQVWAYDAGTAVPSTPAVLSSSVVVASANGEVHAIDRDAGSTIATETLPGPTRSSPVVVDGVLHIGTDDDTDGLVVLTDVPGTA